MKHLPKCYCPQCTGKEPMRGIHVFEPNPSPDSTARALAEQTCNQDHYSVMEGGRGFEGCDQCLKIEKVILAAELRGRQAEREDCAKISEDRETFKIYPGFRRQDEIAKAIRERSKGGER